MARCLSALVLGMFVWSTLAELTLIDQIIEKHWRKYEKDVLAKKLAFPTAMYSPEMKVDGDKLNFEFECQHDKHAAKMDIPGLHRTLSQQSAQERLAKGGAPEAEFTVRAAPTDRQNWQPIRVAYNSTFLGQSVDPRACYSVGSWVQIGTPSSDTDDCDDSNTDDCWYLCESIDVLDTTLGTALDSVVMPAMIDLIESFARVSRVSGNLYLDPYVYNIINSCGDSVPISPTIVGGFSGPGIPNADTLIYVTARPGGDPGIVAYASGCNWVWESQLSTIGRSLAGYINFCPRYFRNIGTGFNFRQSLRVALHEITHMLGFASNLYQYYRNNDGLQYATGTYTQSSQQTYNGQTITTQKLTTPRVAQFAKEHYACPSLAGVELEEYGGGGTAGSHWERRLAGNELMCGFVNPQMPLTALTLSLLEDTGFYAVNYSVAEPLYWGLNKGCGWATGRCENTWNTPGYFCSASGGPNTCSPEGNSYGQCNYGTFSSVPAYYRHFPSAPNAGGSVTADYCTYTAPTVYCLNGTGSSSNGGSFGPDSTCFTIALSGGGASADCFVYNCLDANTLQVQIGGSFVSCAAGEVKTLTGGATLTCPTAASVCDIYSYLSTWPRLTSVSPSSGSSGGFSLTVTGSNFVVGRSYQVKVGASATATAVASSTTSLTAQIPSSTCCGKIANVAVVDSTNQNNGVLFAAFTFTDCAAARGCAAGNVESAASLLTSSALPLLLAGLVAWIWA